MSKVLFPIIVCAFASTPLYGQSSVTTEPMSGLEEGFVPIGAEDVTADQLEGTAVYSSSDELIANISDLVIGSRGGTMIAVLEVGGSEGSTRRKVSLPIDQLEIMRAANGKALRVSVNKNRAELAALPLYED